MSIIKTIRFSIICLMLLCIMNSCRKKEETQHSEKTLVFGHFYGFCGGLNCIRIFKLEDEKLYEDTLDIYPTAGKFYEGNFVEQSNEKYLIANSLNDSIPQALISNTSEVIGMPDAGDWGGIYVEIKDGSFHKSWLIDHSAINLPQELIPFRNQIVNIISKI